MNALPNRFTTPPGGWRYRVPETGQTFTGPSEHALIVQLQAHYRANGYTVPSDFKPLIEEYVCSTIPDYCTGNEPARIVEGFSFHTVIQGTRTLGTWLAKSLFKGARQYVPQEQADARAAVCAVCTFNDEPQGCTGCNSRTLKEAVKLLVGNRTTPSDALLKSCRICNCISQSMVHLPHDVLWQNMTDAQQQALPAHCWKLRELIAPTPI